MPKEVSARQPASLGRTLSSYYGGGQGLGLTIQMDSIFLVLSFIIHALYYGQWTPHYPLPQQILHTPRPAPE
jgi:hypothetical protein